MMWPPLGKEPSTFMHACTCTCRHVLNLGLHIIVGYEAKSVLSLEPENALKSMYYELIRYM